MGNILVATVTVKGVKPLLWHHFGEDTIPLDKKEKTGVAGNDPIEWTRTVLHIDERQLYLEPSYIFGTIIAGAKNTKLKRGSLQPLVQSTLQIVDDRILVDRELPDGLKSLPRDPKAPVYLDVRSVVNPTTRGRNVRYRVAASSGWTASFQIAWDATVVSREQMKAAVIDACMFAGLGSGRAIGFGRFTVERFEVDK